jgi:SAM-dependent methyltransferase
MSNYKHHINCRVCGSDKLTKYLDLGRLPLTNNLCTTFVEEAPLYPLQIMVCRDCWLSQLSIVVDPEIMFKNYVYRSSISRDFKNHCREMAKQVQHEYGLNKESFHIDVAGNDGCLLNEFRQEIGLKILNIDPAQNLAAICQAREIPVLTFFWSEETARRVLNGYGQADLITATNVFAHINNLREFFEAIKIVLKPTGVLIMEFPYLTDFIDKNEFDCCYQEHLSYFSISPLEKLCQMCGLTLMCVEKQNIHGGSVRVHIGYGKQDETVAEFINNERVYQNISVYENFSIRAKRTIDEFRDNINALKSEGNKIAGFGAAAKGNTLLNCAGITCGSVSYIVDETPGKIGMYSPGTHIPIVSMLELKSNPPDYLIVLPWNFFYEIKTKCREAGYAGKFIIGIPNWEIIE